MKADNGIGTNYVPIDASSFQHKVLIWETQLFYRNLEVENKPVSIKLCKQYVMDSFWREIKEELDMK